MDVVALQDAEEEDDDVDDTVADVDIRQVKKLAVHWLPSLVSEHNAMKLQMVSVLLFIQIFLPEHYVIKV